MSLIPEEGIQEIRSARSQVFQCNFEEISKVYLTCSHTCSLNYFIPNFFYLPLQVLKVIVALENTQ